MRNKPRLSLLDFSLVGTDGNSELAISSTINCAVIADTVGFKRFWVVEHHGVREIASSAPQVLIGAIAERTSTIRVGAGGIMLRNHVPLVIAEQFSTLNTLYANRIDLGLGGARGASGNALAALERQRPHHCYQNEIEELTSYLYPGENFRNGVKITPLSSPPKIFFLGASKNSALHAAKAGAPYVYATHLNPDGVEDAIATYKKNFTPSVIRETPYIMATVQISVTDSKHNSLQKAIEFFSLVSRCNLADEKNLQIPIEDLAKLKLSSDEWHYTKRVVDQRKTLIEQWSTVTNSITELHRNLQVDELLLSFAQLDPEERAYAIGRIGELAN